MPIYHNQITSQTVLSIRANIIDKMISCMVSFEVFFATTFYQRFFFATSQNIPTFSLKYLPIFI